MQIIAFNLLTPRLEHTMQSGAWAGSYGIIVFPFADNGTAVGGRYC